MVLAETCWRRTGVRPGHFSMAGGIAHRASESTQTCPPPEPPSHADASSSALPQQRSVSAAIRQQQRKKAVRLGLAVPPSERHGEHEARGAISDGEDGGAIDGGHSDGDDGMAGEARLARLHRHADELRRARAPAQAATRNASTTLSRICSSCWLPRASM